MLHTGACMYTNEEVEIALENEPLQEALYKMEAYARSHGFADLATWCNYERTGYPAHFTREDVEDYRFVNLQWRDVYNRPVMFPPEMAILAERGPFIYGVQDVEAEAKAGNVFLLKLPYATDALAKCGIQCQGALTNSHELNNLINRIRLEARRRWQHVVPRTPSRQIYPAPSFDILISDAELREILLRRWDEANRTFQAGAYLAK